MAHRSQPININRCGRRGEGINKMTVQKFWKWTNYILVEGGGGFNKSPKVLEMDLQYFGGGGGGAIILVQNGYLSQC